jgi:hypothetical protein
VTEVYRRRPARVRAVPLSVLAAVTALVAGCASGPSQVGSAFIVGDASVGVPELQQRVRDVLQKEPEVRDQIDQQHQLDEVSRNMVTLLVRHELVRKAAQREGLRFDEAQVTELVNKQGGAATAAKGTLWTEHTYRERARDQLLLAELGRKYIDTLSIRFDYVQVDSRDKAIAAADEMAKGPDAAAAYVRSHANTLRGAVDQTLSAREDSQLARQPFFGVPPGTVTAFPMDETKHAWLVAAVKERRTDATHTPGPDEPKDLDPRLLEGIGVRMLAPYAEEYGVRVNPRYGTWDEVSLAALGRTDAPSGVVRTVRQPV